MENTAQPLIRKTHPLILVAATSVTVLSLAGTAHLLGWLPRPAATAPQEAQEVVAAAPASPVAPAQQDSPHATLQIPAGSTVTVQPAHQEKPRNVARARTTPRETPVRTREEEPRQDSPLRRVSSDNGIDVTPAPVQQPCRECGVIQQVREIKSPGEGSGLGAIAGGLLGGVLGNQVGGGNGRKLATVAGAVGGAYAGHQIEKSTRSSTRYEVTVRLEDGSRQVVTLDESPNWRPGDPVRVENGQIYGR
ncbi:glycine zipper 2TM domain-containing protein [Azovibrio restrictus]|uniref:glycine zipper 2TM domain-containing protein n=1 Tax=Azovibrio restrictus TaxID=146938 RepID=UPI0026EBC558|nr:glycine zipper 2TM domain-containing protein [Azovibrio restrictus]MDD3484037.1 glycine zipper 2TM domain-containing protein [Azovibrio restrictus]